LNIYLSKEQNKDYEELGYIHITDISFLDNFVLDGEATSFVVCDYLSLFHESELLNILSKIMNKIRLSGTLIITDVNYYAIKIIKDINQFIEANQTKQFIKTDIIIDNLKNNGFEIQQMKLNHEVFCINSIRNQMG
jgi:hypothetical protein